MSKKDGVTIKFGFVPMPEEIWDDVVDLSLGEFRLLGYLCKQVRFGQAIEPISDDEVLNGRLGPTSARLDKGCGLSRNGMKQAREDLVARGWLEAENISLDPTRTRWVFKLNLTPRDSVTERQQVSQGETTAPTEDTSVTPLDTCNKEVEEPIKKNHTDNLLFDVPSNGNGSGHLSEGVGVGSKKGKPKPGRRFGTVEEIVASLTEDPWEREWMPKIWRKYCELTERAKSYAPTEEKLKVGLERLRDLVNFCRDDKKEALRKFRVAIDNLADNDFLAGNNDRGKEYRDFVKHLCKDWATFERRMLDDPGKAVGRGT